jgi:hypothetical protein
MRMTTREQALLTVALDAFIKNWKPAMAPTLEAFAELYDEVIDAEIEGPLAGPDFKDIDAEVTAVADALCDAGADIIDQAMAQLRSAMSEDDKRIVGEQFVAMMDDDTVDMLFQPICDRLAKRGFSGAFGKDANPQDRFSSAGGR